MKKSILALLFLLFTGIAFSQTTVTLQDQCNCEVLKGTDVSSAGAITPTGADLGDIYVNTSSGTIYFWDGDSWELTASDNQQLTGFSFDDTTNILSLSLEDGGNVNVDLSSLKDVLTDSNTTITSFDIDGTNTNLVITDSEANSYAVALADLAALIDTNTDSQDLSLSGDELSLTGDPTATPIDLSGYLDNTDNQDASEVNSDTPVDVNGDGATEATVEDVIQAIAPITSKAARVFYPPSIAIDASSNGTFSLDLYQEYIDQYGSPTVGSAGAPAAIPTYGRTDLYYYVTYADPTVFDTGSMTIDANGNLSYTVQAQPADYNALINVVFVVK